MPVIFTRLIVRDHKRDESMVVLSIEYMSGTIIIDAHKIDIPRDKAQEIAQTFIQRSQQMEPDRFTRAVLYQEL